MIWWLLLAAVLISQHLLCVPSIRMMRVYSGSRQQECKESSNLGVKRDILETWSELDITNPTAQSREDLCDMRTLMILISSSGWFMKVFVLVSYPTHTDSACFAIIFHPDDEPFPSRQQRPLVETTMFPSPATCPQVMPRASTHAYRAI